MRKILAYTIIAVMAIDQLTKFIAAKTLMAGKFGGYALGLSKITNLSVFVMVSEMFLVVFFCYMLRRSKNIRPQQIMGAGLMIGGVVSNCIDRILIGEPINWILLPFTKAAMKGGLCFNLADVALLYGASILLSNPPTSKVEHKVVKGAKNSKDAQQKRQTKD